MNKVVLIGHVGDDPEVRYLDTGVVVANFSLATNEYYKKDGEKLTITEWHKIVLWRGLAEIAEKYVKKGQLLMVEGKIKTRTYEDKEGKKRYVTEIYGENIEMLGVKKVENNNTKYESQAEAASDIIPFTQEDADDLPF